MSQIPTPPYDPQLLPIVPADPEYDRDNTTIARHNAVGSMSPIELTSSCTLINRHEGHAWYDFIFTVRFVAAGSATNHQIDITLSADNCVTLGPAIYPYNTKFYEPAGIAAGTILFEHSSHYQVNISPGWLSPGGTDGLIYLGRTLTGGAHRVWYQLNGWSQK